MALLRWKRLTDNILTVTDLAQLVFKGFQIAQEETTGVQYKGLTVQIPMELHDNLDAIVKRIPGMSKAQLVEFLLDTGVYEFCNAVVINAPENNLFPEDAESACNLNVEETVKEALSILDRR